MEVLIHVSLKRRKTSLKSYYFVGFSPSSKEREPTFRCTFVHQEWDLNKSVKEDHEVMLLSSRSYIQCLCAFGHAVGHPGRSHQIVLYHHCRRSSLGSRYLSPSFPLPHIALFKCFSYHPHCVTNVKVRDWIGYLFPKCLARSFVFSRCLLRTC